MRKQTFGCLIILSLLIVGIIYHEYEEINTNLTPIDVMQEKSGDNRVLREIGRLGDGEDKLVIAISGETEQEFAYYAAEFEYKNDNKYIFKKMLNLANCGWQNFMCSWGNGYVFVCNNTEAEQLKIELITEEGMRRQESIKVGRIPWIYYIDRPDTTRGFTATFTFINKEGAVIR